MVAMDAVKTKISEVSTSMYETPTITHVQADLKVVLGIIQAEQEHVSDEGYLFGVHIGSTLEITNSSPLPPERAIKEFDSDKQRDIAEKDFMEERQNFQAELSESFRQMQMDSKVVGWYYIAWPDAVTSKEVLDAQIAFENGNSHFILLSYDPWKSAAGKLNLRALRVTKKYRQIFHQETFQKKLEAGDIHESDVYEEIPFSIHVPLLNQLFLYDTKFEHRGSLDGIVFSGEKEQELYLKRQINNLSHSLEALQLDLFDGMGIRQNRRFPKEQKDVEHEAKKSGLLHCQTIKAETRHLDSLVKQIGQNASFLEALSEECQSVGQQEVSK